jgi:hypothetical protein
MKIGLIKSKVEKLLIESYQTNSFKEEIKNFKHNVLDNKKIAKAFSIYDELSKKSGLSESKANKYLNVSSKLFKSLNLTENDLTGLKKWVSGIKSENNYSDIDYYLTNEFTDIGKLVECEESIIKTLMTEEKKSSHVNAPVSKIVKVANTSVTNYLNRLDEDTKTEVKKYLTLSESDVTNRYTLLSEMVVEKLSKLSKSSDDQTKQKIDETISKIQNEERNGITLFKLKSLYDSL